MTDLRRVPAHVLKTTRVPGGVSAKLGSVALAGVLGVVVWIGISGRPPPVPASRASDVAQVPSAIRSAPAKTAATPAPLISPTPEPTATPQPAIASIEADDLSIVATLGNRQFMTWLRPLKQGHLSGTFRMPIPVPAKEGTLELEQVWRTVEQVWRTPSHDAWTTLATWDLSLESLSAAGGREYVVLDRTMPARPNVRDVTLLVARGYRITVRAQSGIPRGLITIDIQMAAGRQLVGNDGIFGWPVVAQLARPTSEAPRVVNGCHWNGRPPPSRRPPLPTYDETSCG